MPSADPPWHAASRRDHGGGCPGTQALAHPLLAHGAPPPGSLPL